MKFIRSRFLIHICSGVFAAELLYSFSALLGYDNMLLSAAIPLIIGIISEIYDYIRENPRWLGKNIADVLSWIFGSLFFIAFELLQRS